MSIRDKFLYKSNSFKFYKENYEKLKSNERILNDELKKKDDELEKSEESIKSLKFELDLKKKECSLLNENISDLNSSVELLKKRVDYSNNFCKMNLKDLNIAYVLNSFPNVSETFIVNEVRWLVENGYGVKVFMKMDAVKLVEIDFEVDIIKFDSIGHLEELLVDNKIDIIHTHYAFPICKNFTYPIAEKLCIPFTFFAHAADIFTERSNELNNVAEVSRSKYCKAIFTLSEYHKNYLIERNVVKSKIIITKQATGYELSDIEPKTNKIKRIVSISRFVEKKGLDVLIDAAKLLESEDFVFELYGFGKLQDDLHKQIDDLECTNISIIGELSPDEVKDVLLNSDLLVSSVKIAEDGDRDGFPTVIFEAMANGLPVLTTKVSAIPEIIKDYDNGFIIDPGNPQLLADKIIEISKLSNEKLFEIRKKAQEDVEKISSIEKTMNRYLDTIKELMCD